MKRIAYLILLSILALFFLAGCSTNSQITGLAVGQNEEGGILDTTKNIDQADFIEAGADLYPADSIDMDANLYQAVLRFEGMSCPSCASGVGYQLRELEGVVSVEVDFGSGEGIIVFDADKITAEKIAAASDVYPATVILKEVYSVE